MNKIFRTISIIFVFALIYTPVYAFCNFVPRIDAPCEYDPRFTTENPFYLVGLGMPNCTAYAWGRAYEILGSRPNLNIGNAMYWFYNDGGHPNPDDNYERGQAPRPGAIAVWGATGVNPFGHVAIVEYVHPDGTVDLSESFWGGENFIFSREVDVHAGGAWRSEPVCRNFLGFIYLCGFVYSPIVEEDEPKFDITEDVIYEEAVIYENELPLLHEEDPPFYLTDIRTLRFEINNTFFTDNNETRILEAAPFIQQDRSMVPLRVIVEALGAEQLAFNAGIITFYIGMQAFEMTIDKPLAGDMGTPVIIEGRTFVPLAFIINEMGASALWDGEARAVYVYIDVN